MSDRHKLQVVNSFKEGKLIGLTSTEALGLREERALRSAGSQKRKSNAATAEQRQSDKHRKRLQTERQVDVAITTENQKFDNELLELHCPDLAFPPRVDVWPTSDIGPNPPLEIVGINDKEKQPLNPEVEWEGWDNVTFTDLEALIDEAEKDIDDAWAGMGEGDHSWEAVASGQMSILSYPYNPDLRSGLPELRTPTSGALLPFRHLLLADSQEVIPPPARTPPSVRLRNIPGPTPTSTPSRRVRKTYAPDSRPPLRDPVHVSVSGTSGLSSDLGL
ncbi:uncharacterized protein EI90DRAFT_3123554 [Cantharellus anzutake]|uniref:uncharacterized protein n=1 Tax=Cantharellus anzutake TaxID=1750568 RepID=UPI0019089223|nr:uncharacterized protein EI90DRAFT_3123554 [Cantharellus anzutake]KAF8331413.1 hypothetical protein EI90DRAFT_3123554 [Cantharellus anzutake]